MSTKVEEVATALEILVDEQTRLIHEARLGLPRRRMYEKLKEIRAEINKLVQLLGTFG